MVHNFRIHIHGLLPLLLEPSSDTVSYFRFILVNCTPNLGSRKLKLSDIQYSSNFSFPFDCNRRRPKTSKQLSGSSDCILVVLAVTPTQPRNLALRTIRAQNFIAASEQNKARNTVPHDLHEELLQVLAAQGLSTKTA